LVEFKLRRDVDRSELPLAEAVDHIVAEVRKLEAELAARAIDVEYQE
jgi:hypothetical protein